MNRGKPLNRGTSELKRGELKRKTPMQGGIPQPRSSKQTKPRKTSASTVVPPATRQAVLERDDHHCQRCGRYIFGQSYSLQHRRPRGNGGSKLLHTMANLVTLCGSATSPDGCHSAVESYRIRATREGWLVPMGIAPEDWPVLRFGQLWSMPGQTWVEVEPHSMQLPTEEAA